MSKIKSFNDKGEAAAEVDFADELLVLDKGDQAVKDVVVATLAARRAGTASTLGKGEVAGSNKKPWKQKGTGNARAGFRRSPVWRGGGVAMGPKPRCYCKKVNRKVVDLAFRHAVSEHIKDGKVVVVESLPADGKTRNGWVHVVDLGAEDPEGCKAKHWTGRWTSTVVIHPVTKKAEKDNLENNTLLKSLGR